MIETKETMDELEQIEEELLLESVENEILAESLCQVMSLGDRKEVEKPKVGSW